MTNFAGQGRRCRWPLLAIALALGAGPAQAEVYRCTVAGVVQFSDRPCQGGDTPLAVQTPNVVQREPDAAALAEQYDRRISAEQKARSANDAAWRKDYETRSADTERIRSARANHQVVRGMTVSDVQRLLGEPQKKTAASGKGGKKETWSYADQGEGRVTLTVQDGVVSEVRRSGGMKVE